MLGVAYEIHTSMSPHQPDLVSPTGAPEVTASWYVFWHVRVNVGIWLERQTPASSSHSPEVWLSRLASAGGDTLPSWIAGVSPCRPSCAGASAVKGTLLSRLAATSAVKGMLLSRFAATSAVKGMVRSGLAAASVERGMVLSRLVAASVERGRLLSRLATASPVRTLPSLPATSVAASAASLGVVDPLDALWQPFAKAAMPARTKQEMNRRYTRHIS
jgi:hypothetical protein